MMALFVYILCGLTSLFCTLAVGRAYLRNRVRLLLWCSLCFLLLTANNLVLFVDLVLFPGNDFSAFRTGSNFLGMMILVYGLVWDSN